MKRKPLFEEPPPELKRLNGLALRAEVEIFRTRVGFVIVTKGRNFYAYTHMRAEKILTKMCRILQKKPKLNEDYKNQHEWWMK